MEKRTQALGERIVEAYPETQAIYPSGSYSTEAEWPTSDVDIAVLLPLASSKCSCSRSTRSSTTSVGRSWMRLGRPGGPIRYEPMHAKTFGVSRLRG